MALLTYYNWFNGPARLPAKSGYVAVQNKVSSLPRRPTARMSLPRCSQCGAVASSSPADEPFLSDVGLGIRHNVLLNSNEVPLDSDTTIVNSVAAKTNEWLTFLDEEMARLRDRLKQLEEEHASLSQYTAQNQAILSPLRRIPPEVLAEIFSWTLPSVYEAMTRDRLDIADSPWSLTHISGRWRAVALSTPSLWSQLVIVWSPTCVYPLSMAKIQIQRARTIRLHFYGSEYTPARPQTDMFEMLSECSSQWEDLSLSLTSAISPFLPTLRDRVPTLRKLWIQWQRPESQAGVASIDSFHTAPSLSDVGIFNEYRYIPILLPAHQLTRYFLDGPWEMHKGILKLAPNIVQARIDIAFDEEPWPDSGDIITLMHLRRLYVSDGEVLDFLTAPSLQRIAIYHPEDQDLDSIDAFVGRSGCTLQRLSLKGFPSADETAAILRRYPSITQLGIIISDPEGNGTAIIRSHDLANTLIARLIIPNPAGLPAISPQLSEICFGCQDGTYLSSSLYLEMLQSRWTAEDCALKCAALLIEEGPSLDQEAISDLDALGTNLVFREGWEALDIIDDWLNCATEI